MMTSNELPSNICCKYFYFSLYTSVRAVIFTFFTFSIVYNDMIKTYSDLAMLPFHDDKEWVEHTNFKGDTKNWIEDFCYTSGILAYSACAFVYILVIIIVLAPIISIKNDGVVATVMKPIDLMKQYWSGEMLLEFGIHAEEY